jgi:uncharacterized membrane protein YfcA
VIEISNLTIALLTFVAFFAGLFSAVAGAGGMITLPVLMWAGLPPINAMATNKVQSAIGTLSSTINFFRKGHIDFKTLWPGLITAFVGAMLGVFCFRLLGNDVLKSVLPILLIAASVYFLFSPKVSDEDSNAKLTTNQFNLWVALGMGFYGGFFGPGMATFFAMAFIALLGYNSRKATAHTKPLVLVINGSSAVVFIIAGDVYWTLAICMAVAQFVGARIGSNLVISKGSKIIRPALILASLVIAVKLLVDNY